MKDIADSVGAMPIAAASNWMSKPSLRTRMSIVTTTNTAARKGEKIENCSDVCTTVKMPLTTVLLASTRRRTATGMTRMTVPT
jgi:hypothetical protein